jgi:hypothetical protein
VDKRERTELSREDFRRLPPRVTPEQMIPLQAVVHVHHEPRVGTEDEWHIRTGAVA